MHGSLEQIRDICFSLPEVTEKEAWGMPTFRVVGKMFALFADNHHDDGRIALWLNAAPDMARILADAHTERYFIPPYMGARGWVGLLVPGCDAETLRDALTDAYAQVAPKRLLSKLPGESPPESG